MVTINEKCARCKRNQADSVLCLPMIFFMECRFERKNQKRKPKDTENQEVKEICKEK